MGATRKCALGVKDAIKGLLPAAGSAYEEAVGMVTAGPLWVSAVRGFRTRLQNGRDGASGDARRNRVTDG